MDADVDNPLTTTRNRTTPHGSGSTTSRDSDVYVYTAQMKIIPPTIETSRRSQLRPLSDLDSAPQPALSLPAFRCAGSVALDPPGLLCVQHAQIAVLSAILVRPQLRRSTWVFWITVPIQMLRVIKFVGRHERLANEIGSRRLKINVPYIARVPTTMSEEREGWPEHEWAERTTFRGSADAEYTFRLSCFPDALTGD